MGKKKVAKLIVKSAMELFTDEDVQKVILGTYSDGTIRSLKDCFDGEFLSPKQKEKLKGKKKSKKKKKKQRKIEL